MNGQTLKFLRMAHGLNQREFAKLLGVTYQHVNSTENGKSTFTNQFKSHVLHTLKVTEETIAIVEKFQARSVELKNELAEVQRYEFRK